MFEESLLSLYEVCFNRCNFNVENFPIKERIGQPFNFRFRKNIVMGLKISCRLSHISNRPRVVYLVLETHKGSSLGQILPTASLNIGTTSAGRH